MIGLCKSINKSSKLNNFLEFSKGNGTKKRLDADHQILDLHSNNMRYHNLRPSKSIAYTMDENSRSSHSVESEKSDDDSEQDQDFELSPRKKKAQKSARKRKNKHNKSEVTKSNKNLFSKPSRPLMHEDSDIDERVYVIDYGLATKFVNTLGETTVHKPFCCDER